jgi:hypothetical protein
VPVVFRYKSYKFFFFANEGDPREPIHIHVRSGRRLAKFWMVPDVTLADSYRMSSTELNELEDFVREHRTLIEETRNEFFSE